MVVARAATEDAADPFGRVGERLLEPAVEGAPEERAGDVLGRDLEERIDPRLDRPLAEEIAAEGVNRADPRLLELGSAASRCAAAGESGATASAHPLDLGAETELQPRRRRAR